MFDKDNKFGFINNNESNNNNIKDTDLPHTVSSKVLVTVPASDIVIDNEITINNASINKDRRYYIEFLGSKKLCSLSLSEENGNAIICSIGNYDIQGYTDSTNIVINIFKINADDATTDNFTDLILYEEEVKYLDSKYIENDLVLQNSISLGRVGDIGKGSSAIGIDTIASGVGSHAEGSTTTASDSNSHAEGSNTTASGYCSHAEGNYTKAKGDYSHVQGNNTEASGENSHAEGKSTTASGMSSHTEGNSTTASGKYAHAEGDTTTASGYASHAEGSTTTASGVNSHAEGDNTTASGDFSHAEGYGSKASSQFQHVQGKYNIEDKVRKYAHIVGNGAGDAKRSNAHTLDWQGNAWYSGKLSQEGTPTEDKDLVTKKYVDDNKEYINYNDKLINDKITALHISRNPVSCSTEINKKPLCELFPELLNMTYDTVFKKSISFKVNMDNFVKEYPTVKSAYNKIGVNLYDENDNFIGNGYGSYINGDGLNIVYINTTQNIRFSAYFDKALVEGSNTSMETKNGYMTIQLSIPKGNNKKEFIDKIKNLKLSIIVLKTDFLNLNNESIYTPTSDYNPATKKYVDDNILLEQLPILRIDETNKRIYVNCNNMGTYKKYFVPNKYANVYGFSFIYTNEDSSETEIALIGGAMTKDDFILCARNTDTLFRLILGGTDKYTYTKSTKTLEKGLYGYLKIGNTQEYAPTENYNPATKKYVDDKVASLPQLSFNEAGELVVTINGVSKTFVPKE